MPLAPPVTTTTLPATCIVTSRFLSLSGQHEIEHGGVMTGRAEQYEGMPDRILKAQPLPGVEDDAETVQRAADDHEPQRHGRQRRHHGVIEHESAPADRQIESHREPVE